MRKLNTLPTAIARRLPNCTRLPRPVELTPAPNLFENLHVLARATGVEVVRFERVYREVEHAGIFRTLDAIELLNCGLLIIGATAEVLNLSAEQAWADIHERKVSFADFKKVLEHLICEYDRAELENNEL